MNYHIKITGEIKDNGQIEFDRCNRVTNNSIKQNIENIASQKNYKNSFAEIIGKWPGDEHWNEIIDNLD